MLQHNKIYNSDCFDLLPTIDDASIDLIIDDIPYGIDYQSNRRKVKCEKIKNDDNLDWLQDYLSNCFRILKNNTSHLIFSDIKYYSYIVGIAESIGYNNKTLLVWDKGIHGSGNLKDFGKRTEYIIHLQKGNNPIRGKRDANILRYNRIVSKIHPTPKPPELYEYLMTKLSDANDLVLDNFAGIGTIAIAANNTGRQFIGIEIDSEYAIIAQQRLII